MSLISVPLPGDPFDQCTFTWRSLWPVYPYLDAPFDQCTHTRRSLWSVYPYLEILFDKQWLYSHYLTRKKQKQNIVDPVYPYLFPKKITQFFHYQLNFSQKHPHKIHQLVLSSFDFSDICPYWLEMSWWSNSTHTWTNPFSIRSIFLHTTLETVFDNYVYTSFLPFGVKSQKMFENYRMSEKKHLWPKKTTQKNIKKHLCQKNLTKKQKCGL